MKSRPNLMSRSPQSSPPLSSDCSPVRWHEFEDVRDVDLDEEVCALDSEVQSVTHQRFLEAMAGLPEPQRQIVELAYFEGLSPEEIAVRLDLALEDAQNLLESGLKIVTNAIRGIANDF